MRGDLLDKALGVEDVAISLGNASVAEESKENPVLTELPKEPVTLYQYEVCPFCNKLRAFLDYNNIAAGGCRAISSISIGTHEALRAMCAQEAL